MRTLAELGEASCAFAIAMREELDFSAWRRLGLDLRTLFVHEHTTFSSNLGPSHIQILNRAAF